MDVWGVCDFVWGFGVGCYFCSIGDGLQEGCGCFCVCGKGERRNRRGQCEEDEVGEGV